MASPFPYPVPITCLQWDCDGALNDEDREWMLQQLAVQAPQAIVLVAQEISHQPRASIPF